MPTTRPEDEIESRVLEALDEAVRRHPDHDIFRLKTIVFDLIHDRRRLQERLKPSAVDEVLDEVGQAVEELSTGAEKFMDTLSERGQRISRKSKTFLGDVRQAMDRFRRDA